MYVESVVTGQPVKIQAPICPWPIPAHKNDRVPEYFCWTKMGVEAGQSLSAIIQRKELERQLGDGMFVWGIGNALSSSLHEFGMERGSVPLLFSPIQSKPRNADSNPGELILWQSFMDEFGNVYPLPEHCMVTSRSLGNGSAARKRHYALFCFSSTSLHSNLNMELNFNELQNAKSRKPLGYSQVTAFVRRATGDEKIGSSAKIYDVPFRADLLWPFCARLTDGVEIPGEFATAIERATLRSDLKEWASLVSMVRREVKNKLSPKLPLFQ